MAAFDRVALGQEEIQVRKKRQTQTFETGYFRWGRGLPHEGVGAKKFGMSLKTREIKLFWRDIPGSCWDIPAVPEKFELKFVFNFLAPRTAQVIQEEEVHRWKRGPDSNPRRSLARRRMPTRQSTAWQSENPSTTTATEHSASADRRSRPTRRQSRPTVKLICSTTCATTCSRPIDPWASLDRSRKSLPRSSFRPTTSHEVSLTCGR